MMEFLWSRAALAMCGVLLLAAVASGFAALEASERKASSADGLRSLSDLLESFPAYGEGATMTFEASSFLSGGEGPLVIAQGWVGRADGSAVTRLECAAPLELEEQVSALSGQTVRLTNKLVDGRVVTSVQLEKA